MITSHGIPKGIPKGVATARARVAGLTARGADPDRIAVARAELAEQRAEADIGRWPPLSDSTRERLAALVLAGGGHVAT